MMMMNDAAEDRTVTARSWLYCCIAEFEYVSIDQRAVENCKPPPCRNINNMPLCK